TKTNPIIGRVKTSAIVSLVKEDVSKIKIVEVKRTEISSTKCPILLIEETYCLVRPTVSPITVTASIPVSCMTTSPIVKQIKTQERIMGDVKYSGTIPLSTIKLMAKPMP